MGGGGVEASSSSLHHALTRGYHPLLTFVFKALLLLGEDRKLCVFFFK